MPVVADVDPDLSRGRVEDGVSKVAGAEVEFFPEPRAHVRDVMFPILPEIRAVSVDYGGGVVVDAGNLFFVNRHDEHHAVLSCDLAHSLNRRSLGDAFHHLVPAGLLLGAEVRAVEEFLETQKLHASPRRFVNERQVLVEHPLLDVVSGTFEGDVSLDLYQPAAHDPAHWTLLSENLSRRSSRREPRRSRNSISAPKVCQGTYNPRFVRPGTAAQSRTRASAAKQVMEVAWLPTCR